MNLRRKGSPKARLDNPEDSSNHLLPSLEGHYQANGFSVPTQHHIYGNCDVLTIFKPRSSAFTLSSH